MATRLGDEQIRAAVRDRYAASARQALTTTATATAPGTGTGDGGCCETGCCGGASTDTAVDPITSGLYEQTDPGLDAALAASLGCGNPTALAGLRPGEDVLDLGSGGGLDVLLSARRVAPEGTAYGLDMTPEMLALARRNQAEAGIGNATFLQGRIEDVPLPDGSVDVIISNCVINLSTDKDAVLGEALRVLRPGGRVAVSDIVLLRDIPEQLRGVVALWTGCVSGALLDTAYQEKLAAAGFTDATVEVTRRYTRQDLADLAAQVDLTQIPTGMDPAALIDALDGAFASAFVRATKPPA